MQPKMISLNPMLLAGVVATGQTVGDIDISLLWRRFIAQEKDIPNRVNPGKGYELHIQIDDQPPRHFTLIGVEVDLIESLPLEMVAQVVPGGTYAQFTHRFKEGDYGQAFKKVYEWVETSEYEPAYPFDIQVYDERFKGPGDPESVLEILVPLRER